MSDCDPIQMTQRNGVTVATPGSQFGSVYEGSLPELAPLLDLAESIDPPRLVIDLATTRYIGSAFIGFVLSLSQRVNARPNGRLGLANVSPFCRMALETTKSERLLDLFESVDDAVAELGWQ